MHRHVALLYPGRAEIKARMAQAFAFARQHGSWEFDHECCRSDGTIYLQNCVVTALYDNDGALQGFANLIRDVTLERAHELALQEREHELRLILETAPDAVFVFDADGCIEYINEAASRMFGYDLVNLKGQNFESLLLVCPSEDEVPDEYPFRIVDVSEKIERQLIGRHHNGSNFPTEMTFVRMEANGGTRFTAFVRDLSEQEATKARLETLQAEMLDGTRYSAMGAMASMLSHELTQPLTALAAYMEGAASCSTISTAGVGRSWTKFSISRRAKRCGRGRSCAICAISPVVAKRNWRCRISAKWCAAALRSSAPQLPVRKSVSCFGLRRTQGRYSPIRSRSSR